MSADFFASYQVLRQRNLGEVKDNIKCFNAHMGFLVITPTLLCKSVEICQFFNQKNTHKIALVFATTTTTVGMDCFPTRRQEFSMSAAAAAASEQTIRRVERPRSSAEHPRTTSAAFNHSRVFRPCCRRIISTANSVSRPSPALQS